MFVAEDKPHMRAQLEAWLANEQRDESEQPHELTGVHTGRAAEPQPTINNIYRLRWSDSDTADISHQILRDLIPL